MTRLLLALTLTLCACGPLPYMPPRPDTVRVALDVLPKPPVEIAPRVLP